MSRHRGSAYIELLLVLALLGVLVAAAVIPAYRQFSESRAAHSAALALSDDLSLLEREAQNGSYQQGSSLVIVSTQPLRYICYRGRPSSVDPQSKLGDVIVERAFADVELAGGPLNSATPLLFASNGSAQFVSGVTIAPQHQVIPLPLRSTAGNGKTVTVELNLYTGAVNIR